MAAVAVAGDAAVAAGLRRSESQLPHAGYRCYYRCRRSASAIALCTLYGQTDPSGRPRRSTLREGAQTLLPWVLACRILICPPRSAGLSFPGHRERHRSRDSSLAPSTLSLARSARNAESLRPQLVHTGITFNREASLKSSRPLLLRVSTYHGARRARDAEPRASKRASLPLSSVGHAKLKHKRPWLHHRFSSYLL